MISQSIESSKKTLAKRYSDGRNRRKQKAFKDSTYLCERKSENFLGEDRHHHAIRKNVSEQGHTYYNCHRHTGLLKLAKFFQYLLETL